MKEVLLDEVCEFINGGAWSEKEYVSEGIPVLKVSNCKPSGFSLGEVNYLPFDSADKYAKNKLKKNDVIIATVGSHPNLMDSAAGRSCIVNSLVEGFFLNQNAVCLRSKDTEVLNQTYLGYLSQYYIFQNYIQMLGRGAANQMRIAIGAIKSYKFFLPDIVIQNRIADILSTYDKLIENNQKQLRLLDEAVRRIYKEWFIDFHFPGYEETANVNGIPKGWRFGFLEEISSFKRGKTITKAKVKEGCIPVVAGGLEPAYYHNEANTTAPVITVSGSGANAGFARLYYNNIWASDCSFLDITSTKNIYFVYCYLKANKTSLDNLQKGAAQPHVYAKDINVMKVCIPSEECLSMFSDMAESIFVKIGNLEEQNKNLQQARDRLLPKLMNGELEV